MNQAQLIDEIAANTANTGTSKATVKFVLDAMSEVTHAELKKGGEVTLPGIGKLHVEHKEARKGRNPSTGAEIDIPAKSVPKFSAAKALKDAVNS
ncbi:MAG: HU family DNA-binding protein [Pseudomonadota bacterium]